MFLFLDLISHLPSTVCRSMAAWMKAWDIETNECNDIAMYVFKLVPFCINISKHVMSLFWKLPYSCTSLWLNNIFFYHILTFYSSGILYLNKCLLFITLAVLPLTPWMYCSTWKSLMFPALCHDYINTCSVLFIP